MEAGKWKWSQDNPLIVIERSNGTLISFDNRRLAAARQASNVDSVPVRILKETGEYLDCKLGERRRMRLTGEQHIRRHYRTLAQRAANYVPNPVVYP